jgi:hypothetical protein
MGKRSNGTRGTNSSNSAKSRKTDVGAGRDIELAKKQYHEYVNDNGYLTDEEGLFDKVDLLAKPLKENTSLYRGGSNEELDAIMSQLKLNGGYDKLVGKTYTDKYLKSTTTIKRDAIDYTNDVMDMNDMREMEGEPPLTGVLFHYNAKKGTKVINRKEHDNSGGRGAAGENTIAHNQKYTITNIKEVENRYGDNEYHVYVDVEGNPSKQTSRKRK